MASGLPVDGVQIPLPPGIGDTDSEELQQPEPVSNPANTAGGNPVQSEHVQPAQTAGGNPVQEAQRETASNALQRELQELRGSMEKMMKILESQQQSMKDQEKKHQEGLESMEKRLAEEKLQAKVLQLEQQVEINKLKSEAKGSQEAEAKADNDKIVSLKGFDFKSVPKPDRYDLKPEKFTLGTTYLWQPWRPVTHSGN